MSRASRKSELSPAITKGSSAIDLGKNSGVDMGRKARPSATSGGIGITQEVTNVGGVSVNAGANLDITPFDFGISVSPSDGTISVATGAEIPGGLLGISGGIEIDANTGQITGGSIGGEALGLGVNVSNSEKGGLGIELTVQIPGTPISLSLGLGFPPEPKKEPIPTPSPGNQMPGGWEPGIPPGSSVSVTAGKLYYVRTTYIGNSNFAYSEGSGFYYMVDPSEPGNLSSFVSPKKGSELNVCQAITQDQINGITTSPGSKRRLPASSDSAYYAASLINRIEVSSPITYLAPFGIVTQVRELYYRKCVTLEHPGIPGLMSPTIGGIKFSLGPGAIYNPYDTLPNKAEGATWQFEDYELVNKTVIELIECGGGEETLPPLLPSFPNPPPRRNMDECCRENTKLLREIHKRLGISKFPGKLPETIIQETPEEGVEPAEPAQVPIEDFVDLLDWQFQRDDERWGKWQVELDIKDSDITQEGDQKKQIKLPNLAESVAEFQGQLLSIMTNVDALVALQVKTLAEAGMSRQEAIKSYLAAKAIIKYMAFKSSEIDVPVPMTFTAGAETISELLIESEGHIKGTEYAEKETLRDVQLDLLQAAAIIRAVHWQRIDTKSDTKSQLLNILKGSVNLAASIATKPQTQNEDDTEAFNPESNFEDFIDSVENGFRDTTGVTDVQNPYGKPPNRRPRIKQIGDNISQAGVDN